jgi:hypothetical protein
MLRLLVAGFVGFIVTFVVLRLAEWLYHQLRKTPDWSPHWGTWAFAVLAGLYAMVTELGR